MPDPTIPITTTTDPTNTTSTASGSVADSGTATPTPSVPTVPDSSGATGGKTLEEKLGFKPAEPPTTAPAEPNVTPTPSDTTATATSEKVEIPFTATVPKPEDIALAQAKAEALLEGKDPKSIQPQTETAPTLPTTPAVDNSGGGNVPLQGKKKNLGNVLKIGGGLVALTLMIGALAAATGLVKIPGIGETRRYALEQGWGNVDQNTQNLFVQTYGSLEAGQAHYEAERTAFENLPAQQQAQVDQVWQQQGAQQATQVLQQITGGTTTTTPDTTTTTTTGQGTVTTDVPQCTATTGVCQAGQPTQCSGGFCPVYRTNADGTLYGCQSTAEGCTAVGGAVFLGYISEEQYKPPAETAFVGMNSYSDLIGFNQGATENVVVVNASGNGTIQDLASAIEPKGFCTKYDASGSCTSWISPDDPVIIACSIPVSELNGQSCNDYMKTHNAKGISICENQFDMTQGCSEKTIQTVPTCFCGTVQVDYGGSQWVSYEGYCGCEETPLASRAPGASGNITTFVTPPNPPIPGLFCSSLEGSIASPKVGDNLTLTCTAPGAVVVNHFEFRYQIDGSVSQPLVAGTAQSVGGNYVGTSQMTVSVIGSYTVECRVCKTADSSQCTNWGLDQ